jgi:hypothetical protein
MVPCPRSYGYKLSKTYAKGKHDTRDVYTDPLTNQAMVKDQFCWFVSKGDLLLPSGGENREFEQSLFWKFRQNEPRVCSVSIYEYLDDDDVPDRYATSHEGLFGSEFVLMPLMWSS